MTATFHVSDDFTGYAPGHIPNDYTPWGEYHCRTDQGRLGPWREATTHYTWRNSGGGCWRIIDEETGQRAVEQQFWAEKSYPLLVTGDASWRLNSACVRLRTLSFAAPAGLVVDYRHSRDFLALLAHPEHLSLVHRRHGEDRELASVPASFSPDEYRKPELRCTSGHVRVLLDDVEVSGADWTSRGGPAGLLAHAPARFAEFEVTGRNVLVSPTVPSSRPQAGDYPAATLWKRIDTEGFGSDRNLRIGDINGDGQNEIVIAQPLMYLGRDNHTMIRSLTAVDLDGNILWQQGTPVPEHFETTCDLCFQLHDLDAKGRADIVYTTDLQLRVASGLDGETLRCVPTPNTAPGNEVPGGFPMARTVGDCLHFADLRGTGNADTIILKDRYSTAWAYDQDLNLLWEHACTTGHYPASFDIDGDGRDELMLGYDLLDGEGNLRWRLDTFDHADGIVMGRFGPGDAPIRIALTGSDAGFFLLDVDGTIRQHHDIGHAQTIVAAKLRNDIPGLQLVANTYWGEAGITVVMDHEGHVLTECEPVHYASLLQPVNWTFDDLDLMLLSTHPEEGGLLNGHGERVVMFPNDGHPVLCCDVKDVDGDGVDEILTWDEHAVWIYKPDPPPAASPETHPIRNAVYNDSNYSGQFSFPIGSSGT
ncbi:MAG: hypothetical protein HN742_38685 [Lentisphaerae bacterium]|nr:hypothetical protein [Lentisphaerota bacterium]